MTSHLIFDFFGTLVEYSASRTDQGYRQTFGLYRSGGGDLAYDSFVRHWASAFSELDEATSSDHREYSMLEAARAFLRSTSLDPDDGFAARLASSYLGEWNTGVRDIEGVAPMLTRLSEAFDLSVITNTHDPDLVPRHLERLGVASLLSQVITSVAFGKRKPSPTIFEHATDALGVPPARCLYVGDSFVNDFQGPRAAGMRALLIDAAGHAPVAADERVDSILAVEAALGAARPRPG